MMAHVAFTLFYHYPILLTNAQKEDPRTNSMHPYMADERKSKKSEGIVDSAKITGTVDVDRKLRK